MERKFFIIAAVLLVGNILPYFLLGENASLEIHDNLDGLLVRAKILLDSGGYFSLKNEPILQMMNGIPRSSFSGNYSIGHLWFWLFGTYYGYAFNKLLMCLTAFAGMYLLLKTHILPDRSDKLLNISIATLFGLLPFWGYDLSVAGLPFLMYIFLGLRKRKFRFSDLLILVVAAFYTTLVLSGFFFLCLMVVILGYDIIARRKIHYPFFIAMVCLSVGYIISHYPMFSTFFIDSDYVSHRSEFRQTIFLNFVQSFNKSWEFFFVGYFHAASLQKFIPLAAVIAALIMLERRKANPYFVLSFLFLLFCTVFWGLKDFHLYAPIRRIFTETLPLQNRFYWLAPTYWYILFAISLSSIAAFFRAGKQIAMVFIVLQLGFIVMHHELIVNRNNPSFKQFYAEDLFDEMKTDIGTPVESFRVINVGIFPAIAQYNGFYTLDGYTADYPLSYKHEFRKVIAAELDKNAELKSFFDNWGSVCYAFVAELGWTRIFGKDSKTVVEQLEFDVDQLKGLGGRYIISAIEINTDNNEAYRLIETYTNDKAYWKIHLYEIM